MFRLPDTQHFRLKASVMGGVETWDRINATADAGARFDPGVKALFLPKRSPENALNLKRGLFSCYTARGAVLVFCPSRLISFSMVEFVHILISFSMVEFVHIPCTFP